MVAFNITWNRPAVQDFFFLQNVRVVQKEVDVKVTENVNFIIYGVIILFILLFSTLRKLFWLGGQ